MSSTVFSCISKFKKGKDLLVWSVAGFAVALSAYGILSWVMYNVLDDIRGGPSKEECLARPKPWDWHGGKCQRVGPVGDPGEGQESPEEAGDWERELAEDIMDECERSCSEKGRTYSHIDPATWECVCGDFLGEESPCLAMLEAKEEADSSCPLPYYWVDHEIPGDPSCWVYECRGCGDLSDGECQTVLSECQWTSDFVCTGAPGCSSITLDPLLCGETSGCSVSQGEEYCADK